ASSSLNSRYSLEGKIPVLAEPIQLRQGPAIARRCIERRTPDEGIPHLACLREVAGLETLSGKLEQLRITQHVHQAIVDLRGGQSLLELTCFGLHDNDSFCIDPVEAAGPLDVRPGGLWMGGAPT